MSKPKIACIIGTRPDVIKTAPVVLELKKYADKVDTFVVSTGQHKEILHGSLDAFGLTTDYDLDIMTHGQTLTQITTKVLEGLENFFRKIKPDFVLVQGDTTTTFAAALNCFYNDIPLGHIEAGLRTDSVWNPYPEEFNRRAVSMVARQHYAPTLWAANNLQHERIPGNAIFITGNTGIDSVKSIAQSKEQTWYPGLKERILLLTTHRRENWGDPQKHIAQALVKLLDKFADTFLVVPMHPNPFVRKTLRPVLEGHTRVNMIDSPDYADFVKLIQRSHLIFTDSGGIQEEAPTFGVPVAVLRECTERPEGIQAGTAVLVGTNEERVYEEGARLLSDQDVYQMMTKAQSPYGDGHASRRIRYLVLKYLGIQSPKEIMWISSKPLS